MDFSAAGEVAMRLLADRVPRPTMAALQRLVQEGRDQYPLAAIAKALAADPIGDAELYQQLLRAERDWILRGGRERRAIAASRPNKSLLARILGQSLLVAVTALAVLSVLLAIKVRHPELLDAAFDWLHTTFPQTFPGR
jgi:hypothetical protein